MPTATGPRILGIDPGSHSTGWGLVTGSASRPQLSECGVIRLDSGDTLAERLGLLYSELNRIVAELEPTSAGVEAPFLGASARSALQLAHARGVILAVLAGVKIEVAEYSPATVKKSITGSGRADKIQVARMVDHLLGSAARKRPHDLSDALAVALCHFTLSAHRGRLLTAR